MEPVAIMSKKTSEAAATEGRVEYMTAKLDEASE